MACLDISFPSPNQRTMIGVSKAGRNRAMVEGAGCGAPWDGESAAVLGFRRTRPPIPGTGRLRQASACIARRVAGDAVDLHLSTERSPSGPNQSEAKQWQLS
jgi:hypothetical protein